MTIQGSKARPLPKPRRVRRSGQFAVTSMVLAVAFGALAIVQMKSAVDGTPAVAAALLPQPSSLEDFVEIPTPARPVAKGERIRDVPFTTIRWPKQRLNGQYLTSVEGLENAATLAALPELIPMPISAIARDGVDGNAVVERIPEGMRAITIRVDSESAVEGWARTGNTVDVILIRAADSSSELEAKIVAMNVRILSVNRTVDTAVERPTGGGTPPPPATVTLLTTQEDALRIKTAGSVGKLTFSLRGTGDMKPAHILSIGQRDLSLAGSSHSRKETEFRGYARGPDGTLYGLASGADWVVAEESLTLGANSSLRGKRSVQRAMAPRREILEGSVD